LGRQNPRKTGLFAGNARSILSPNLHPATPSAHRNRLPSGLVKWTSAWISATIFQRGLRQRSEAATKC